MAMVPAIDEYMSLLRIAKSMNLQTVEEEAEEHGQTLEIGDVNPEAAGLILAALHTQCGQTCKVLTTGVARSALRFVKPFFQVRGKMEKWQLLADSFESAVAGQPLPCEDTLPPLLEKHMVVADRIRKYHQANPDAFPNLSDPANGGRWPSLLPTRFLRIADQLFWLMAHSQLERYWARGLSINAFALRGAVKKYNTFLVEKADAELSLEQSRL